MTIKKDEELDMSREAVLRLRLEDLTGRLEEVRELRDMHYEDWVYNEASSISVDKKLLCVMDFDELEPNPDPGLLLRAISLCQDELNLLTDKRERTSLSDNIARHKEEECHLGDPIPEEDKPAAPEYSKEIEDALINIATAYFTGIERDVLLYRFRLNENGEPQPLDAVMERFTNVSKERILFLEARAFRLLKHPRRKEKDKHE